MKQKLLLLAMVLAVGTGLLFAQSKYFKGITDDHFIKSDNGGEAADGGRTGRVTLVAGVAAVADTSISATTNILVQRQTVGGTKGVSYEVTRSAGTSFTITSLDATNATQTADTSVIGYAVHQP